MVFQHDPEVIQSSWRLADALHFVERLAASSDDPKPHTVGLDSLLGIFADEAERIADLTNPRD